jgi:hypothetical protein
VLLELWWRCLGRRRGVVAATFVILDAVLVLVVRRRSRRTGRIEFLPEGLRTPGRVARTWPIVFVETLRLRQLFLVRAKHQMRAVGAWLKRAQRNGVILISAKGALADAQDAIGDFVSIEINDDVVNFAELLALLILHSHADQLTGFVNFHNLSTARSAGGGGRGVGTFIGRSLVRAGCRRIFILRHEHPDREDRKRRCQNGGIDS